MMTRSVSILLVLVCCCLGLSAQKAAHGDAGKQPPRNSSKPKKLLLPTVYLGQSDITGGEIQKDKFTKLMKQGLTSRDSLGIKYRVIGFDFTYAERKLYETENADLVVMTDLSSEHFEGDTLSSNIAYSTENFTGIYDRIKPGDTLYFDHVQVVKLNSIPAADSSAFLGKGMKFAIVK
jgi:hypothetical protein